MQITIKKVTNGFTLTTQSSPEDLYDDDGFAMPRGRNNAKTFVAKDIDEVNDLVHEAFTNPPKKVKVLNPIRRGQRRRGL